MGRAAGGRRHETPQVATTTTDSLGKVLRFRRCILGIAHSVLLRGLREM